MGINMSFVPSIHDVEITVNAENCCNGCCLPIKRRNKEVPKPTDIKIEKVAKKTKKANSYP